MNFYEENEKFHKQIRVGRNGAGRIMFMHGIAWSYDLSRVLKAIQKKEWTKFRCWNKAYNYKKK